MTPNAKKFVKANDWSSVIEGEVIMSRGVVIGVGYVLSSGGKIRLTVEDARSLPEGYPKWMGIND